MRLINQLFIVKDVPVALCVDGTLWALNLSEDDEGKIDFQKSEWIQLPSLPTLPNTFSGLGGHVDGKGYHPPGES
jgi:hypothetical protein